MVIIDFQYRMVIYGIMTNSLCYSAIMDINSSCPLFLGHEALKLVCGE